MYANFEVGQAGREDTERSMRAMLGELASRARRALGDETPNRVRHAALEQEGADGALIEVLARWAEADARPLVLLIGEIDTLVGDTLLSVLRQLRAGYDQRPDVNGGGRIEREYALGRGRTGLLIVWPRGGREQRWVVECKVGRGDLERAIAEGIAQTRAYMDRCGAEAGHLIVFDRTPERSWEQKIFRRNAPSGAGAPVTVWACDVLASRVDESPRARSGLAAPAPARGGAAAQQLTVAQGEPSGSGNHSRVRLPPFALVRVAD